MQLLLMEDTIYKTWGMNRTGILLALAHSATLSDLQNHYESLSDITHNKYN